MPTGRPRKIPSRTRLPYKTGWALDDILEASTRARGDMDSILRWLDAARLDAKGRFDNERLARLGELAQLIAELALEVGEIERKASDARIGEYHGETKEEKDKK